jgi:tetratricopeptide (TPR) repeat protein
MIWWFILKRFIMLGLLFCLPALMPLAGGVCYAQPVQSTAVKESLRALYEGDYQRAARLAEERLQLQPNDAAARVMLARAAMAQGKFKEACAELRRALTADPRNIDALYYLSLVASALSQQEYERLYAIAPESDRVHQLLGEAAVAQEKPTEAEEEFLAALKGNPHSVEVLTALGELKRSQSKFDEAIEYYSRAEAAGPFSYDVGYGLGACYTYKQDYKRAIEYLRRAIALAPDSADGHFALGNALFQSGQAAAAIPELQTAVTLEPKLKQGYFLLGRAYQKLGQQARAKEYFKKLDDLNRPR